MNDPYQSPSRLLRFSSTIVRWVFGLLLAVALLLLAGWVALHGWIVPRIGEFRPQLEQQASRALGLPVRIGAITARSTGVVPSFSLHDVAVLDRQGREALRLLYVAAAVSPVSLWRRSFVQLYIDAPELDIRRDAQGRIFVAGLDVSQQGEDDGRVADWLFSQAEVVVRRGEIRWSDDMLEAPPLALHNVDMVLRNGARRHALRLDATPPVDWGERFTLMGQFRQPLLLSRNGDWKKWSGQVYAHFPRVDVSQLRRHVSAGALGFEVAQGNGAVRAWGDVRSGALEGGAADVALSEVNVTLGPDLQPLALKSVQGRFAGQRQATGFGFSTQGLQFQTDEGLRWPGGNVKLSYTEPKGTVAAYGELHANQLDLSVLSQIASRLPLGAATHAALATHAPAGLVETLDASWQGELSAPEKYQARGRVTGLSMASHAAEAAGMRGGNVDFELTQLGGRASVDLSAGALYLPGVFDDPWLPFDVFTTNVRWQVDGEKLSLQLDNLRFANADAQGQANVHWHTSDPGQSGARSRFPGVLDLTGSLSRAKGGRVYRYLPRVLDAEVRSYVEHAVRAGTVSGAEFRVKGDLHDLPFPNPKQGEFRIAAKLKDVVYAYVPSTVQPAGALPWPALTRLSGELVFERTGMQVRNASSQVEGMPDTRITRVDAQIPDLQHATVAVSAEARGPLSEAVGLVSRSPLSAMTSHALDAATATGQAQYQFKLGLPLHALPQSSVQGRVTLAGNDVRVTPDTPLLGRVRGVLDFSEAGFSLNAVQAHMLGGDVRLDGGLHVPPASPTGKGSAEPVLSMRAQGQFSAEGLRQAHELGLLSQLAANASGAAPYTAVLGWRRGVPELQVSSSLQGLALDLPYPLGKAAGTSLPLRFDKTLTSDSLKTTDTTVLRDQLQVKLGSLASMVYERDLAGAQPRVLRGALAVGLGSAESVPMPESGVVARGNFASLDLDAWRSVLSKATTPSHGAVVSGATDDGSAYIPTTLALQAQELIISGRTLHEVVVGAGREGTTWRANASARELNGYLEYRQASAMNPGGVFARLARLSIPRSSTPDIETMLNIQPTSMPALDIVVDELELGGRQLGHVELEAVNQVVGGAWGRVWRLHKLNISVPEADVSATGGWAVHGEPQDGQVASQRTVMDFTMDIRNSGELLARLGMPDVLRRGKGRLQGQVSWSGSPLALDYPSMTGQMHVDIESGQFLKADPGLAKLLGVLSLQALPRRLSLDFKDVFSQGFAFDFVRGDVRMDQGIASTNNLQMRGVNAAVLMEGSANMVKETQDLRVVVVPEINAGTASLVAAVINPAVGLGTFLAQMFLRGTLMEAATQEFHIDGSWAEPRITRVTGSERSGIRQEPAP